MNKYSSGSFSGNRKKVAVVGPRGYSGQELVRLLANHPAVDLKVCFVNDKAWSIEDEIVDVSPEALQNITVDSMPNGKSWLQDLDLVFLATPHEASILHAREFLSAGVSIIDLSGAFRLNQGSMEEQRSLYQKYYQIPGDHGDLLAIAQYGLTPWCGPVRQESGNPVLIANPGCYATAISMALVPALKAGALEPESLVIDAKSGTTGAGRKAAENLIFSEADESIAPYRVGKHQHLPEIKQTTKMYAGVPIDPHFATHLLPIRRGISAGIYARPGKRMAGLSDKDATRRLEEIFREAYQEYPLVRFSELGSIDRAQSLLSLNRIARTPNCHLVYGVQDGKIYLFSMIDNLMKGAASQAVENLNRWLDLPLTTGLY